MAATRPTTEGDRKARVGPLAQGLVPTVGGVGANGRHPARVAVEERLDSSLSREVLDVLQVNATTEYDREAAMPLLTPL